MDQRVFRKGSLLQQPPQTWRALSCLALSRSSDSLPAIPHSLLTRIHVEQWHFQRRSDGLKRSSRFGQLTAAGPSRNCRISSDAPEFPVCRIA